MRLCVRPVLPLLLCCLLVLAAAAGEAGPSETSADISVEPAFIPIGMAYSGATVRVRAQVPAGYEAAIRLMGKAETLQMKRKGKIGGVLWMSAGEVTFKDIPVVYFLVTTRPLADLAPAKTLQEWILGYEALASTAGSASGLFPQLVMLKEKEDCFLVREGQLVRSSSASGGSAVWLTGSFRFPAQAPAGEYTIDLFGFHEGRVDRLGSTALRLEYTGIAKLLRSVATEHGLIYGGVAIIVAVLAGLATGFVFHPRRSRGK